MTTDAVIMMVVILTLVWGGFITSLVLAFRQEGQAPNESGGNSESKT